MKLMPVGISLAVLAGSITVFTALKSGATTNEWYPGGSGFTGWPINWVAIPSLNDPKELTEANARVDFVGDSFDDGAYWSADSNYFYIRVRVAVSNVTASTFRDSHWIYIDRTDFTNGAAAPGMPDYAIAWDSKNNDVTQHGLELETGTNLTAKTYWSQVSLDDIDGNPNAKISPPDFNLTGDGYIRTIDMLPTANFGYTTFIDFAIKWSFLTANTALDANQEWRIQFGSRNDSHDHNFPQDDIAGGYSPGSVVASSYSSVIADIPLSSALALSAFENVNSTTLILWTTDEAGVADIVIDAWIANAWLEVGRVLEADVVGQGSNRYVIEGAELTPGQTYIFRMVDESGLPHYMTATVQTRAVKMLAMLVDTESIEMTFATEENRQYVIMGSSNLVTWVPERVRSQTYVGWSELADTPFTAGPGTQTQVVVPRNERKQAFFKLERMDW